MKVWSINKVNRSSMNILAKFQFVQQTFRSLEPSKENKDWNTNWLFSFTRPSIVVLLRLNGRKVHFLWLTRSTFSHGMSIFHCIIGSLVFSKRGLNFPLVYITKLKSHREARPLDYLLWCRERQERWWNGRTPDTFFKKDSCPVEGDEAILRFNI